MDYGAVSTTPFPYLVMELLRGATLAELLLEGGPGRLSFGARPVAAVAPDRRRASRARTTRTSCTATSSRPTCSSLQGRGATRSSSRCSTSASPRCSARPRARAATPTLTATGMVIGSPPYMSRAARGAARDVDLRTDSWSLAVIVYESITGTPALPHAKGDPSSPPAPPSCAGHLHPRRAPSPDLPRASTTGS